LAAVRRFGRRVAPQRGHEGDGAVSGGPVQLHGEILSVQRVGEYTLFTVVAPKIAAGFQPGHFVVVAVGGENTGMILRRAFAIAGATPSDRYAGTVQFVVAEHGPGTRWLVHRRAGETLDVVGPLGTPFPIPSGPSPAVLVGGGYGCAPLIPLAQALLDKGSPVEFVLGAATATRLFGELTAKRMVGRVTVTTDDGSAGEKGLVTDVLPEVIERINAEIVYACGPMGMLQAVGQIAGKRAIRAQVAVEESMACGIGVCMTCVLPVRGSDGKSRFVRSCVEGPVFDALNVRWGDVGKLPADIVGADAMGGGH
jgi:dihydroorotate dehydrogenase electron transfer subunit